MDASVADAEAGIVGELDAADFRLSRRRQPRSRLRGLRADAGDVRAARRQQPEHGEEHGLRAPVGAAAAEYLRDGRHVVVAPFRNSITTVTGPTRDAATLAEAVDRIKPRGGTAILESLCAGGRAIRRRSRPARGRARHRRLRRAQQRDPGGRCSSELKAAQVIVYIIAVGGVAGVSVKGEQMLRLIAEQTGGRAFFPWNAKEMATPTRRSPTTRSTDIVVTYTPSNQRHDGAWRAIRLETAATRPTACVARAGYLAPSRRR